MKISIIVGLGNQGKEYARTYHNVGFLAIQRFRELFETRNEKAIPLLLTAEGMMNVSGASVLQLLRKHHKTAEELLLVHDDTDLALGTYKYSVGRGSAGHKGVESVIQALGTSQFSRLRIGVREPLTTSKALDLVLSPISPSAMPVLQQVFEEVFTSCVLPVATHP